jgi:alanine dehydrogenase
VIIGVPKEIKAQEYRVAVTPAGVEALVGRGHEVLVETGAGVGSGLSDGDYRASGAAILSDAEAVYRQGQMIVKVKEFFRVEWERLREGQLVLAYLHTANNSEETQALLERKVVGLAYEDVKTGDGQTPLLAPMSEIAGEVGLIMGAYHLFTTGGGPGLLLGGAVGAEPARVAILGAGRVGLGAARAAIGLGADVTILDIDMKQLREVREKIFPQTKTLFSTGANVRTILPQVDLLINAVKWPPKAKTHIVTREMLKLMKREALIVDISCDPAGAIETCVPTSHEAPIYEADGIRHYCVANLPSAVARIASSVLSNAILPYVIEIADKGWLEAIKANSALRRGLTCAFGHLTFEDAARAQHRVYTPPEEVIRLFDSKDG